MNTPSWSVLIPEVEDFLRNEFIPYKRDFDLKYETYFKSGGRAKLYIMPHDLDDFVEIIRFLGAKGVPYKVIGLSTNVLFLNELEYGVIITTKNSTFLKVNGNRFEVGCGYMLSDLVRAALINGYGGIEGLEGVPGTIGGGVVMNAGAYGYTISDYLCSVTCVDVSGNLFSLDKEACKFSYRDSVFKCFENYVIVSAVFELPLVDRRDSASKIEVFHIARHSYQEFSFPNLGSMYSIRQDFYRELLKGSIKYSFVCFLLKLLYKNPVSKFLQRKRPNNAVFNKLAMRYMSMSKSAYQPSIKSMNILINDGVATTEDLLTYISSVRGVINKSAPVENEIILAPVLSVSGKFNKIFDGLMEGKAL